MKKLFFIGMLLVLFSCKEEKKEVLDINDVIPKAERSYDEIEDEAQGIFDSIQLKTNEFASANILVDSLRFVTKKQFPDRFGTVSSEKYRLFNADSSILFQKWTYADSSKTMNAFFNWIDCFGKNCDSYKIGEETKIGVTPKLIAVNDTTILMIEGEKINIKQWEDFLSNKGFENWHYWIEQKPYRKAEWFTINEEKIKLNKNEINR